MIMKRVPQERSPARDVDDHDRGLTHDLGMLIERRLALALLGSAGLAGLLTACGDEPFFGRADSNRIPCSWRRVVVSGGKPSDGRAALHPQHPPKSSLSFAPGKTVLDRSGLGRR